MPLPTQDGRSTGESYGVCISPLLIQDLPPTSRGAWEPSLTLVRVSRSNGKKPRAKGMNGKLVPAHQEILLSGYCISNRCG